MLNFVSKEGASALRELRVRSAIEPTGDEPPIRLLARTPSEDCGCPEELWRINGMDLLIHLEGDGSSEAFIFAGDWEAERAFDCDNLDALRAAAFGRLAELGQNRT